MTRTFFGALERHPAQLWHKGHRNRQEPSLLVREASTCAIFEPITIVDAYSLSVVCCASLVRAGGACTPSRHAVFVRVILSDSLKNPASFHSTDSPSAPRGEGGESRGAYLARGGTRPFRSAALGSALALTWGRLRDTRRRRYDAEVVAMLGLRGNDHPEREHPVREDLGADAGSAPGVSPRTSSTARLGWGNALDGIAT